MKLPGKITATAICVAVLCGSVVFWRQHTERADQAKLNQSANELRIKAEKEDVQAQYALGNMYYHGKAVRQDYAEAARWYRKSAEQGFAKGQYNLGYLFQYGQGVSQDYSEAARWYRKSAEQGYASAQVNLAVLYYRGQGVPRDYVEAVRLYTKAADQGDAGGEDGLGFMYYRGDGVKQDYAESAHWYRMAADQGLARAQYALGTLYYNGLGVSESHAEANRWFYRAAKQGDPDAQSTLGTGLSIGEWVELSMLCFGGILLLLGSFLARKAERGSQVRVAPIAGGLCILTAALSWYGYTHYLIRPPLSGLNLFTALKWVLEAGLAVLLIYTVRPKKKAIEQSGA